MRPRRPPLHRRRRLAALGGLGLAAASAAYGAGDLTAMSLEQLLELRVVAASKYEQRQAEAAAAVSIITRDEIRAFGWRTLDDALASLPGTHLTYNRQHSQIGTRGFGLPGDLNTRLLLTINGNRVNELIFDTAPTGADFPLDLALIERIEFIPGPGSALYGQNAMFGVVNVVTRNGADLGGVELVVAAQQPQRLHKLRASFGRRLDNGIDLLVSASALRARGEDRALDFGSAGVSGVARNLDGERDRELFVRASRGDWSLELVHGSRRKDDPTGVYFSDPLVPGQYQGNGYTLVQAQLEHELAGDTHLSGRLFAGRTEYSSILSYGTAFDFPAVGDWRGAELRLLATGWAGHKLLVGVEAQDIPRIDQSIVDLANPGNNLLIPSPGYRAGVFVQDEWQIAPELAATLGLRVDRNDRTGTQRSPRAALIWQASPTSTLKLLAGRAHRAPNANERDYYDNLAVVGNPSLRGERIDTYEAVADHRVGADLAVRAALYRWTMHDIIQSGTDPVSGLAQFQSAGEVHARGVELSLDKTWAWGGRLRGSLSHQDVNQDGPGFQPNSPTRLLKLNFSTPLGLPGAHLGVQWRAESARRTLAGATLGGMAVTDVQLSASSIAPGVGLTLGIANLFDRRIVQPGGSNNWQDVLVQDGRSARLSLQFAF